MSYRSTAAHQYVLGLVPEEVQQRLFEVDDGGAHAWTERAKILAEALAAREQRYQRVQADNAKMIESLLQTKAALEVAQQQQQHGLDVQSSSVPSLSPERKERPQSGMRLLLVEDDVFQGFALQEMCKREGYVTTLATSGKEAVATLTADRGFDLVLCDVMMPEMDGYEVLTWIRRAFKPSELTVVMISASDNVDSVERCLLHGAESYMLK